MEFTSFSVLYFVIKKILPDSPPGFSVHASRMSWADGAGPIVTRAHCTEQPATVTSGTHSAIDPHVRTHLIELSSSSLLPAWRQKTIHSHTTSTQTESAPNRRKFVVTRSLTKLCSSVDSHFLSQWLHKQLRGDEKMWGVSSLTAMFFNRFTLRFTIVGNSLWDHKPKNFIVCIFGAF